MLERSQQWLLLTVLFLTPLVGLSNNFEQSKVWLFVALTSLAGLIWILRKVPARWTGTQVVSLIFVLSLTLTGSLGLDPENSFLGREPYYQGVILYLYLWLFAFLISGLHHSKETLAKVLTATSLIVSLAAIKDFVFLNFFHVSVVNYAGRVVSTFGQPNFYAGFLVMSLPFSFHLIDRGKEKLWVWIIPIMMLGIFISYSKTSIFLMMLIIYGWLTLKLPTLVRRTVMILSLALIIFSLIASFYFQSGLAYTQFLEKSTVSDNGNLILNTVEKRNYLWLVFWEIVKQSPFLGSGLANINLAYKNYFLVNKHSLFEANSQVSDVLIRLKDLNVDSSHNYLLDLLLFSGTLGLAIYLILVVVMFRRSKGLFRVGLIIYLIWVQFQNQSVIQLIYFWTLIGVI